MRKLFCNIFVLLAATATAQTQSTYVNGYLRDSMTHLPISGGVINNPAANSRITTDYRGFFRILAAPGNKIYASAPNYRYDTITFQLLYIDTVSIFLSPTGALLPGVTVTSKYNKYQLDSIRRLAEFTEARGHLVPTFGRRTEGFGLIINLDRTFKKKYRDKASAERLFRRLEEQAYIDYRFSPHLLTYYTGLKGQQLRTFLLRYTPSYIWLRQHPTNDEVLYYLNEKIKEYRQSLK
jgi:hypothetical protein